MLSEEFIAKIKKDFGDRPVSDWKAFLAGYMACLKRFGGSNGPQTRRK